MPGDVGRPGLVRTAFGLPGIHCRRSRMLGQLSPHLSVTDQPQLTAENRTSSVCEDPHRGKGLRSLPRILSVRTAESRIFKLWREFHCSCRSNGSALSGRHWWVDWPRGIHAGRSSGLLDGVRVRRDGDSEWQLAVRTPPSPVCPALSRYSEDFGATPKERMTASGTLKLPHEEIGNLDRTSANEHDEERSRYRPGRWRRADGHKETCAHKDEQRPVRPAPCSDAG